MLPAGPSFERLALNRVTFGAREDDLRKVADIGWTAWVEEQLTPPDGDEERVANHIATRSMHIAYAVQLPAGNSPGWPAVDERRGLNYLNADLPQIWDMVAKTEISVAPNERRRIQRELAAATWMRHTHARYQLREFMADFWNCHFNIGRQEDVYGAASLAYFDKHVTRPRVFGNFRDLLEAVASSAAMLRYLNNAASGSVKPTENYVRELLELHTLGAPVYWGVEAPANIRTVAVGSFKANAGFTDQDIVQAARAFSGWTVEQGQQGSNGKLPFTGRFIFNPVQHSGNAGRFMGLDLSRSQGIAQGRMILDILAAHPATAQFVCEKLCRRIFGDTPPPAAVARAVAAWMANREKPDQIKYVLRAVLLGPEIGMPASKVRRPYERLIALFRTTSMIVHAYDGASDALGDLGDGMFAWPTPEGRPDHDSHWLAKPANLQYWNLMFHLLDHPAFNTSFTNQTPPEILASPSGVVEHWVGKMVGYALRPAGMKALIDDVQQEGRGFMAAYRSRGAKNIEDALRRLAVLIATSPEFALR